MPFAAPPTGENRFGFPKPPIPFTGIRDAVEFGAPCPQQAMTFPPGSPDIPLPAKAMSEDCLFINVVRPANVSTKKPLPVLFWFYGGGFEDGDTSLYPGEAVVNRSLALGEPVIYVSANYRLNAFGFLAGKEVKDRGLTNVGLRDQRFALQWVQQNIAAFGGNPKKVTIWGESAGSISVGLHMLLDKGDTCGLFSGAIMAPRCAFQISWTNRFTLIILQARRIVRMHRIDLNASETHRIQHFRVLLMPLLESPPLIEV